MELKNIYGNMDYTDSRFNKQILFSTPQILSFVLNFRPGQSLPLHAHENSTFFLSVINGSAVAELNGEQVELTKGSTFLAKGSDTFSIPTINEDTSMLVILSPNPSNKLYAKPIQGV